MRYQVNIERNLHGALLDARILLDVYLAMTGGQSSLLLDEDGEQGARSGSQRPAPSRVNHPENRGTQPGRTGRTPEDASTIEEQSAKNI